MNNSAMSPQSRTAALEAMQRAPELDVLIIGGGVVGAGIALDAATPADFVPRVPYESTSLTQIRDLVSHGLGIALVPESAAIAPGPPSPPTRCSHIRSNVPSPSPTAKTRHCPLPPKPAENSCFGGRRQHRSIADRGTCSVRRELEGGRSAR